MACLFSAPDYGGQTPPMPKFMVARKRRRYPCETGTSFTEASRSSRDHSPCDNCNRRIRDIAVLPTFQHARTCDRFRMVRSTMKHLDLSDGEYRPLRLI
jgi:hypothetical protein